MFKNVQVTLYDFFGYLLPGGILCLAIRIGFQTIFWRTERMVLWSQVSTQGAVVICLVAYVVGHLAQGVGNLLQRLPKVDPDRAVSLPAEVERSVRKAVSSRFALNAEILTIQQIFELCDEALQHSESLGEREIFTYREGFYRGTFVSLIFLALALHLQATFGLGAIRIVSTAYELTRGALFAISFAAAGGAWLALERYKRFSQYRTRRCLLRFLALETTTTKPIGRSDDE